jgi:hypothetical protein
MRRRHLCGLLMSDTWAACRPIEKPTLQSHDGVMMSGGELDSCSALMNTMTCGGLGLLYTATYHQN